MASGATFDDLQQKMKFTNIVRSVKSKERSGNMVRARSTSSSNGAPASCGVTNEQVGSAAHRSAAWPEYVLYTAPALAVNGSIAPWALPSTSLAVSSRSLVASMGSGLRHEKVGRGGGEGRRREFWADSSASPKSERFEDRCNGNTCVGCNPCIGPIHSSYPANIHSNRSHSILSLLVAAACLSSPSASAGPSNIEPPCTLVASLLLKWRTCSGYL